VFPLKDSGPRCQSETLIRTALPGGGGSRDLADTRCRRTVRLSLPPLRGNGPAPAAAHRDAPACTMDAPPWRARCGRGARQDDLPSGQDQRQASPDFSL